MVIYRMSSSRDYSTKNCLIKRNSQSWWPRLIKHTSVANLLLRLRVRIPSVAWIFVPCECCVLYRYIYLRWADPLPRGVLPSMCISLSVIMRYNNCLHLQWAGRRGRTKKINKNIWYILFKEAISIGGHIPLNNNVSNECWTGKDVKWSTHSLISGTILSFVSRYRGKPQNFSQCYGESKSHLRNISLES